MDNFINPFGKPFGVPLDLEDIHGLLDRQVPEGLGQEYKQDCQREVVTKIVASFANSFGGCLVLGLECDGLFPTRITGIDLKRVEARKDQILGWCRSHISPTPLMFVDEIPLADEKAILVVRVPPNQDPPYVTSTGSIYHRYADTTQRVQPELVKDRYQLDRITSRGEITRDARREFFAPFDAGGVAINTDGHGLRADRWAMTFLRASPSGVVERRELHNTVEHRELLSRFKTARDVTASNATHSVSSPSFHLASPTNQGVILRQSISRSHPGVVSWGHIMELLDDGSARIFVPIEAWQKLHEPHPRYQDLEHHFAPILGSGGWLIDARRVLRRTAVLLQHYRDWLGSAPLPLRLEVRIKMRGIADGIPMLIGSTAFDQQVSEFGPPFIGRDVDLPNLPQPSYIYQIDDMDALQRDVIVQIARSMALQSEVLDEVGEQATNYAYQVVRRPGIKIEDLVRAMEERKETE